MSAACEIEDLQAVPTGDFSTFFRAYYPFVWRSARRLGTPRAALDDVVQEVFLAVYRRPSAFAARSSLKTWLYGVTANLVKMRQRKEVRRRRRTDAAGAMMVARPRTATSEQHEAVELLDRLVRVLEPAQRLVFVLIELEDVAPKAVARDLDISINTVHSRLRLARKRVRAEVRRIRAQQKAGR